MSNKLVQINLPEKSEGCGTRKTLLIDSDDPESIRDLLRGCHLGVMDTDLDPSDVRLVDVLSVNELGILLAQKKL